MAAVASIATGSNPEYYSQVAKGAEYYTASAGQTGMEPAGVWTGAGCPALGLAVGSLIDPHVFEALYGEFTSPVDGTRLGRKVPLFKGWKAGFDAMLAAEPEATAERKDELRDQAKAQVRQAVQYYDVTFSPSKSITLLHASFLANSTTALDRADLAGAGYWAMAADDVWECITAGNQAMLDYLHEHAGYTRSGYRGIVKEDAHQLVVGSFRQHTSRSGDPQLHVHNVILNRVQRDRDGKWTALDGKRFYDERGAASAQGALVMENALSGRMGVGWVQREDGHGREIAGVGQPVMDEFSKRTRQEIAGALGELIRQYAADYGHAPDARALNSLRLRANKMSRAVKHGSEPGDLREAVRSWAREARSADVQALEPLGPAVSNRKGPGSERSGSASGSDPSLLSGRGECAPADRLLGSYGAEYRLIAGALEKLQSKHSTWTRSDLIRFLGEMLPDTVAPMSDAQAAKLLPYLAEQALAGTAGAVVLLEAPELITAPDELRRANGESVFTVHGTERYATQDQLTMEEHIVALASERSGAAPRVSAERAASLLGADRAQLEEQLDHETAADVVTSTRSGLHLDQAAAAYRLLTSDRRVEVMVGPAGTGKTRTVAEVAKAWQRVFKGARVVGLTTSQQAAQVLRAAGVKDSHNISMFLTKKSLQDLDRNSLVIMDEGSMISMRHYARVLDIVAEAGGKVAVVGDHHQLGSPEGAGGLEMLARELGFVQLSEPMRFREEWQREGSLRLRAGEATVLTEYDQQGRLRYGTKEEMVEEAYRAWLADYLAGRHSALITHDEADAAELSRRARGDLIHFGRVEAGRDTALRKGARASAGDRIMARQNDHKQEVGVAGRKLTNRDVLEVLDARSGDRGWAVEVRLLTGRDAEGAEQWGKSFFLPRSYVADECHLAYGVTVHSVEGSTFGDNGYSLIRPSDTRKTLYTAMTRARGENIAYVVGEPERADEFGAPQADPEVARARRLARERAGVVVDQPAAVVDGDAVSVLGQVIRREDLHLAASETQAQNLASADHLGTLGGQWIELVKDDARSRFGQVLAEQLSDREAKIVLDSPASTWLFRELRSAERAGLDGAQVLADAIEGRPLTGARDIAKVLHGRVFKTVRDLQPQVGQSWQQRVPEGGNPAIRAFLAETARFIDGRVERLGAHTADTAPLWATRTFGPVPSDPVARADWEQRAAVVGAYREMHGYDNPGDAIGPEPSRRSPEANADWHAALAAQGSLDGMDLAGVPDAVLNARIGMYERETSWAPEHVGEQLRLTRKTISEADRRQIRAGQEARVAHDADARAQHDANRAIWAAMKEKAYGQLTEYEKADLARKDWAKATEATRRQAVAAQLESQRRHPEQVREQLRSAEPESTLVRVQATADAAPQQEQLPGMPEPERERASSAEQDRRTLEALGLTRETVADPMPEHVERIRENTRSTEQVLAELRSMPEPDHDEDIEPSEPWAVQASRERDSVLQPPSSYVDPAPELGPRAAAQAGMEAGE